jgi:hypothetical protein
MKAFRLSKGKSYALLAGSFAPLGWFGLFFTVVSRAAMSGHHFVETGWFPLLLVGHMVAMLGIYGLIAGYIYIAARRGWELWQVMLLGAALFCFHVVALPIVWNFLGREQKAPKYEGHAHGVTSVGF